VKEFDNNTNNLGLNSVIPIGSLGMNSFGDPKNINNLGNLGLNSYGNPPENMNLGLNSFGNPP
jgi:hypothetical protein